MAEKKRTESNTGSPRVLGVADATGPSAEECRRRMLLWPNPVEYVNDMYGCHPGEGDTEYFKAVFGNDPTGTR